MRVLKQVKIVEVQKWDDSLLRFLFKMTMILMMKECMYGFNVRCIMLYERIR